MRIEERRKEKEGREKKKRKGRKRREKIPHWNKCPVTAQTKARSDLLNIYIIQKRAYWHITHCVQYISVYIVLYLCILQCEY